MKVDKTKIKKYYQKEDIANKYISRRFSGAGGDYVNKKEISTILDFSDQGFKNKNVVDLAAGTGRLTIEILKLNPKRVTAIDSSTQMLDRLKNYKDKNLFVVRGLAENLPLKDSSCNFVFSLRLFEHLKIDVVNKVLEEIYRVLDSDGELVFNTVNRFSAESILVKLFRASSSSVYPISGSQIKSLIEEKGFTVKKTKRAFLIPRGVFLHLPKFLLSPTVGLENIFLKTPFNIFASHIVWYCFKK